MLAKRKAVIGTVLLACLLQLGCEVGEHASDKSMPSGSGEMRTIELVERESGSIVWSLRIPEGYVASPLDDVMRDIRIRTRFPEFDHPTTENREKFYVYGEGVRTINGVTLWLESAQPSPSVKELESRMRRRFENSPKRRNALTRDASQQVTVSQKTHHPLNQEEWREYLIFRDVDQIVISCGWRSCKALGCFRAMPLKMTYYFAIEHEDRLVEIHERILKLGNL